VGDVVSGTQVVPNQQEPIAKRIDADLVEYVCPKCGWYDLSGVFRAFLPFVDHLIQDYCFGHHPLLSCPIIQHDGTVWFQKPGTNELILGLPCYSPASPEWKVLLSRGEKMLPAAKLFLPDIADWLEKALLSLEELDTLETSNILTAEKLASLVETLRPGFHEERDYLLSHKLTLVDAATDPKWTGKKGKQASFIARSVAGARWQVAASSSREMIRLTKPSVRMEAFRKLKIPCDRFWWLPSKG
jgi:hypothetical protein